MDAYTKLCKQYKIYIGASPDGELYIAKLSPDRYEDLEFTLKELSDKT